MKKTVVALLALIASTASMQAQSVIVYKTDGTSVKFPAEEVQRIAVQDYGEEPVTPGGNTGESPAGAKAIDLGLPSGTKWANMNIGATSPQENGLYFAWGETTGNTSDATDWRQFDWPDYKWMTEDQSTLEYINKYQADDKQTDACWYEYDWDIVDYKFVGDGLTVLEKADDAASANWGGDWRMPTYEDFQELFDNCTSEWITVGNVSGRKFTSRKNGNVIFFPAAGFLRDGRLISVGWWGRYWSASLYTGGSNYGRFLDFDPSYVDTSNGDYRCYGQSVRAVLRDGYVITMSDFGLDNAADATTLTASDSTTLTFSQEGGKNAPKYYTVPGGHVRMYALNSLTITSSKTITQVVVDTVDSYQGTVYTGNDTMYGEADGKKVTIKKDGDTKVTFSDFSSKTLKIVNDYSGNSGGAQLRVMKLTITYAE